MGTQLLEVNGLMPLYSGYHALMIRVGFAGDRDFGYVVDFDPMLFCQVDYGLQFFGGTGLLDGYFPDLFRPVMQNFQDGVNAPDQYLA